MDKITFHGRWWLAAILFFVMVTAVGCSGGEEEAGVEEEIKEPERVVYDVVFAFAEYTVDNIRSTIDDDEVQISFDWTNQSGMETPFLALGFFEAWQGEEYLEEISGAYRPGGNSSIQRQTPNGVTVPGEATFKIVNDEPIVVKFYATHESDDREYELIIE